MTASSIDFPTWFTSGCYGGLACCMFAIAANALYTALRKRGTTRQLAGVIVICVLAALLLMPAMIWYNMRFTAEHGNLAFAEVEVMLAYIALCGWLLPLGTTSAYCLFALQRSSTTAQHLPLQKKATQPSDAQSQSHPGRYRTGTPVPFVYGEDIPWGWLEYRGGSFQGQRLALKRAVITIGREEDNDIWIDNDLASRRHAELTWHEGKIYLTDCNSLNGVLLNEQRVQEYTLVSSNDVLEIGNQRFVFVLAERKEAGPDERDDPLARHTWRSSVENENPSTELPKLSTSLHALHNADAGQGNDLHEPAREKTSAASPGQLFQVGLASSLPLTLNRGVMLIRSGEMNGQFFIVDRSLLTIGRGPACDIVLHDASLFPQHILLSGQTDGDFIQNAEGCTSTWINGNLLVSPRLLHPGDAIRIGNTMLEYTTAQAVQSLLAAPVITPPPFAGSSNNQGPSPLRLPTRPK